MGGIIGKMVYQTAGVAEWGPNRYRVGSLSRRKDTPNQALQQTGHANNASARRHATFRVSRLLSFVFGEGGRR